MKPSIIPCAVWKTTLTRDLILFWIIATSSLCAGLFINQFRDKPLPLVYQSKAERLKQAVSKMASEKAAPPALTGEVLNSNLSLEQFRAFTEGKKGLVLDARPEIFHRLGHVPGALSLSRDDFEKAYAKVKDLLEKDKNQALVLYCATSSCEDSHLVQTALSKLGYTNVAIFTGGWAAWTQANLPEEVNP